MQDNLAPRDAMASRDMKGRRSEQVLLVTKLGRPSVGADLVDSPATREQTPTWHPTPAHPHRSPCWLWQNDPPLYLA